MLLVIIEIKAKASLKENNLSYNIKYSFSTNIHDSNILIHGRMGSQLMMTTKKRLSIVLASDDAGNGKCDYILHNVQAGGIGGKSSTQCTNFG